MRPYRLLVFVCPLLVAASSSSAAQYQFGSSANNFQGQSLATLTDDGITLTIETTLAGAVLNESSSKGVGVDTGGIVGVLGGSSSKFDVIQGTSPSTGQGEQIRFSFDTDGILKSLDFDGVKDENFEFFLLQTATSEDLYFFDSFNGSTADPQDINVPGTVVFLQEDPTVGGSSPIDDKSRELFIRFTAGQEFLLTYGELVSGNGARFQGITVHTIPEPSALLLAVSAGLGGVASRRRNDRTTVVVQ